MTTDSEFVAAIDLGSNSFHMLVARVSGGQVAVLDKHKEMVRLAGGLDARQRLDDATRERALACLERFGQRLRTVPPGAVRAVGTNTLRRMADSEQFLHQAEAALGHPIDVIAGREEARLIYIGVAHTHADTDDARLVVDIGGGSTELIVGRRFQPREMDSLNMGCVSLTRAFFGNGKITEKRMYKADMAARLEVRPVETRYREMDWTHAVGASGTAKALAGIAAANGWTQGEITLEAMDRMRAAMVKAGSLDKLELAGLEDDRRPVIAGGLVVMRAVFQGLEIERMSVSDGALREGLLYDLLGRREHDDVRGLTLDNLGTRFEVDRDHARRVESAALYLFDQVEAAWSLEPADRAMLSWASQLHELGLGIAHSGYHKHGAYVLANADMPGFSQQEQAVLAALVRSHRRKLRRGQFRGLPEGVRDRALRLTVLLRLATLLHRNRSARRRLPEVAVTAREGGLELGFPDGWLDEHPLTRADLEQEADYLQRAGFGLAFA